MKKLLYPLLLAVAAHMYPLSAFADDDRRIYVSILPQKYFVQQICKDRVQVEVMVQPGASPHTYEPRASQMTKLTGTAAYFAVGDSFETAWLGKLAAVNPNMKIVHTDANIAKIAMAAHGHEEEHSKPEGMHHADDTGHLGKGTPDPHIWLSPTLVRQQVKTMLDALIGLYPDQAQFFTGNAETFLRSIDELDAQLREILKDSHGKQFMVFHPSWGYFAREYGLEQVPVEIEGKQPKPAQIKELIEHAREKNIRVIFAQPQFSTKSAQIIAREIGGEVTLADPLAEDWPANLLAVAKTIHRVVNK